MKRTSLIGCLAIILMIAAGIACQRTIPGPQQPTPEVPQVVVEPTQTPYTVYGPAISSGPTPQATPAEGATPATPPTYSYFFPLALLNSNVTP